MVDAHVKKPHLAVVSFDCNFRRLHLWDDLLLQALVTLGAILEIRLRPGH